MSSPYNMEPVDRERPISYPSPPQKPETSKNKSVDAQAVPDLKRFRTHIRLFVKKTGEEKGWFSGSTCEIRGRINAHGQTKNVSADLPENKDFSGENNGLGRLVADLT